MTALKHHFSELALNDHGQGVRNRMKCSLVGGIFVSHRNVKLTDKKSLSVRCGNAMRISHESGDRVILFSSVVRIREHILSAVDSRSCSDFDVDPCYSEEKVAEPSGHLQRIKASISNFFGQLLHPEDYQAELLILALPAIVGQAVDPLAQLAETACIGRLGAIELAAASTSVAIFNIISKLFNIPLLSITTSLVAEDISKNTSQYLPSDRDPQQENAGNEVHVEKQERQQLPSVSTALLLAVGIGAMEGVALFLGAGQFVKLLGVQSTSPMYDPARHFLSLRALGAPAVVLSLAIQGIFRGFKDTQTPLFCVGLGNFAAVCMLPVLVHSLKFGLAGAAIATVASQYIITALLVWVLNKRAVLLPPKVKDLQFGGYIKSGGLLLARTLSVLITMTLATSMAARQGPLAMAAHQICMQVWLAVSLLSDALALSAQALIASSFAKLDNKRVKDITFFVLKTGVAIGLTLALALGASFGSMAELFTKDREVLEIVKTGILFVSATQPINALAFIFDGLHYGVSDFKYAACSMMVVGAISSAVLLYAPSRFGLPGLWFGLTLFMALRMLAGFIRLQSKTGPWQFLWPDNQIPEVAN